MDKKPSSLGHIGQLAILLISALGAYFFVQKNRENPQTPERLSRQIYQVRGQIEIVHTMEVSNQKPTVQRETIVMLRNGAGEDFRIQLPTPLPSNAYFLKPGKDKDGNETLLVVPNIEEEQKAEKH